MNASLRVLFDSGMFLESPRWRDGRLWVSDSLARKVITIGTEGDAKVECKLEDLPSGLAFLPGGQPIVVSMLTRRVLRAVPGRPTLYRDLSRIAAGTLNDMIADGEGRVWVGDLGFDLLGPRQANVGRLLLVTPDGGAEVVADQLDYPNGIAVTPDGRQLIVAESGEGRLSRFTIAADGSLSGRVPIGEFGDRFPDGICLDGESAAWVALFEGEEFVRVDLADGREIEHIAVGGRRAVACGLGGPDRRTLFCVTARTSAAELRMGKSAAAVEVANVRVAGAGFP
jgi:sugar lactone lactonase YvrE